MLEYAVELEGKIRDSKFTDTGRHFMLVLCGDGFYWRQDQLEDFVAFYRTGTHRGDDPFAKMETHYIEQENINLDRNITCFACLSRPQFEVRQRRLNWNVQPPKSPAFQD